MPRTRSRDRANYFVYCRLAVASSLPRIGNFLPCAAGRDAINLNSAMERRWRSHSVLTTMPTKRALECVWSALTAGFRINP